MAQRVFIANVGSSSKKYAVFDGPEEICSVRFERDGGDFLLTLRGREGAHSESISEGEFRSAIPFLLKILETDGISAGSIAAAGIRVVAPGDFFLTHRVLNPEYISRLEKAKESAPLHVKPVLEEISALRNHWPDIPIAGISDSAFHGVLPYAARHYAIPRAAARKFQIFRYGYHGISVGSVVEFLRAADGIPERLIICHLGGGSSITALRGGQTVDTSMGFTPLEGLPMETRSGDIDAGAVLYLMDRLDLGPSEMLNYLNSESGLDGLSGIKGGVKSLLAREAEGDKLAAETLQYFAYRVRKYIGAYIAALGGLDFLVLTGTISERSAEMRAKILENLEHLGIFFDKEKNDLPNGASRLEKNGNCRIAVIPAGEMTEMARITGEVLKNS